MNCTQFNKPKTFNSDKKRANKVTQVVMHQTCM